MRKVTTIKTIHQTIKDALLSQPWLTALASISFGACGYAAGRGNALLSVGCGILAASIIGIQELQRRRRETALANDAYQIGVTHAQRRTASR